MENVKKKKHALSEKVPVIAAVLWIFAAMLIQGIFEILFKLTGLFGNSKAAGYVGTVIGAIVFLILMKVWYSPEYKGTLKSGISMKKTILFMVPVMIYSLIILITQLIQHNFYWDASFINILMGLSAGFGEETMFRISAIPVAMGFIKSEKRVWTVPVVTALIFGVMHLGNLAEGATVTNSVVQAIVTGLVGFYYGALLVATGSGIPGIITHAVYDYICFAGDPGLTEGIMTTQLAVWEIVFNFILAGALAGSGVWMIKHLGDAGILKLWKKKWSQD